MKKAKYNIEKVISSDIDEFSWKQVSPSTSHEVSKRVIEETDDFLEHIIDNTFIIFRREFKNKKHLI